MLNQFIQNMDSEMLSEQDRKIAVMSIRMVTQQKDDHPMYQQLRKSQLIISKITKIILSG